MISAESRTGPVRRGRYVVARPTIPADLDRLYEIEVSSEFASTYRHRGQTPSPQDFAAKMWDGAALVHTLVDPADGQIVGSTLVYAHDPLNAIARFAVATDERYHRRRAATEGCELVIDYAFRLLQLRNLYLETTDTNLEQFGSVRRIATEQGRLVDHHRHLGELMDMVILCITSEAWQSRQQQRLSFLTTGEDHG